MKSYAIDNKPIMLMKKAIDIFAEGENFHHRMMIYNHLQGFQGHKRWNRLQSKEDRCMRIEVENYCIDMFGDSIEPSWDFMIETPKTYYDYLEKYLNWEIKVYTDITSISNQLVEMNYNCEAALIGECLPGVRKEIEKIRRWMKEFEIVEGDKVYLLIKDKELHDKVKKMEEE